MKLYLEDLMLRYLWRW